MRLLILNALLLLTIFVGYLSGKLWANDQKIASILLAATTIPALWQAMLDIDNDE